MAKFKHGAIVGYVTKNREEERGPFIYDHTDIDNRAWFLNGTWVDADRVFAWPLKNQPEEPGASGSWDYAEARRLQAEAKAAVEAYNAYVDKKPTDVFFHVMQPFQ